MATVSPLRAPPWKKVNGAPQPAPSAQSRTARNAMDLGSSGTLRSLAILQCSAGKESPAPPAPDPCARLSGASLAFGERREDFAMELIWMLLIGLVAGALAKLLMPG